MRARTTREFTGPDPGLVLHGRAVTSAAALELFLELAAGTRSMRVRRAWELLRGELARVESVEVSTLLARRELGALELARELEKEIAIRFEILDDLRVPIALGDALDVAAVGLLRAVIETGIEQPDARDFAGKPREAQLTVRCSIEQDHCILEITDDGHGNDRTAQAPVATGGGTVAIRGHAGSGTRWTVTFAMPPERLQIRSFTVAGTPLVFAVPCEWNAFVVAHGDGVIDLPLELGLGAAAADPMVLQLQRGDQRVFVGAASEPVIGEARWVVATPPDRAAAVVSIDGNDALLLRPDILDRRATHVAIVDDSEIVRELAACALQPHGIAVAPFAEPAAFIGSTTPADLVLLAPSFKGLDLATVVACIKSARPHCVVYLHSDRQHSELAVLAEATGADGAISKTLAREQFVTRTLRILRAVNRLAR